MATDYGNRDGRRVPCDPKSDVRRHLLVCAGLALTFGSPLALALLPVAVMVIHRGVILREERYLEEKFGAEYLAYKARVRRWL